ncbi:hypothetical protein TD95_003866 [Thielaviopsis punctulata]|uniref:Squalene/phytoene synthase n=1 Tax=Thielaviopsis punctulata TaxID=72032 RepID=A0A0F4ZID3_9PEZI|nr:hypothetical protein TD95_003866 [Thielaviopsis punctulata]
MTTSIPRPVRLLHPRFTRSLASASSPAPDSLASARAHCLATLSRHDRPAIFIHRALPPAAKDTYLALRALNATLLSIPDRVPTPPLQRLRLSFWSTALEDTFSGSPPAEPICTLLAACCSSSSSSASLRFWTLRLLRARSAIPPSPPASLAALESTAEQSYASISYAALAAAAPPCTTADHISSHIAKAAGLAATLRGLPILTSARDPLLGLPLDVLARHGVREELVVRYGPQADGLRDAVFDVATRAHDHLITAREILRDVKAGRAVNHEFEHMHDDGHVYHDKEDTSEWARIRKVFGVFLEAVPAADYLHDLEKAQFDPWRVGKSWKLPFRMWWASSREDI